MYLIDWSKKVVRPKLQVCKNDLNKTVVGNLKEAYSIQQKISLGNINELSFMVPYQLTSFGQLIDNKNITELLERRLIKFTKGIYTEYYIIQKIFDVMENDKDYKKIECYSLGYELSNKTIKDYKVVSYTAQQVLNDILKETIWTVDYIDSEFLIKYRAFDISSATVLEALQQVAEAFNAVIEYDTVNRKINLKKLDKIGTYKGLNIKYGKLLENITYESDTSEYCTRLKAFGKGGLSFNSVNPTGTNYIEDYSSILYGFQRDEQGNVISHAQDISDSLAIALLNYQSLVQSKQGEFSSLLSQKENAETNLTNAQNVLTTLQTELAIIEDNLSVANANGTNTSSLVTQRDAKLSEIANQQSVVNGCKNSVDSITSQITALGNLLKVENNFTQAQLEEWNPHIVVKEWSNDNYTDAKQLFEAAKEEFIKHREPKIVVNISIVNFLEIISEQHNWDKLNLGDIIHISHEKLGINIEAKIMEMEFDYESGEVNLTISNIREILTDQERFIRDMYKSISSSTAFNNSKAKYDDAYVTSSEIYQEIQSDFDAAKRTIIASNNETVEISRKGIIVKDLNDPNKYIVLQHGIIGLTQNGGNTWDVAISPDRGVVAERVKGVLGQFVSLRANQIIVGDQGEKIPDSVISSSNYWNSVENTVKNYSQDQANTALNAAKAYSDTNLISANTYSNNINTAIRNDLRLQAALPTSITLNENGITAYTSDPTKFARFDYRGLYVQNGAIQITSTDGTTIIDGEGITASKVKAGTMSGVNLIIGSGNQVFKANENGISLGNAVFGNAPFRVDMYGNATLNNLTANTATINNSSFNNGAIVGSSINVGNGAFTVTSGGAVTCSNITITGGSISWSNLNSDPKIATAQNTANNAQGTANYAQTIAQQIANGTYSGGTFIDRNLIYSPSIVGGSITSNTDINVNRDINLGNYLRLNNYTGGDQGIVFAGNSSITFRASGVLEIGARSGISFTAGVNFSSVPSVNSDQLATKSYVDSRVPVFA